MVEDNDNPGRGREGKTPNFVHDVHSFPNLPDRISGIGGLAYNLWWSWHPEARMLYKMLDRPTWKETVHNPVKTIREVPDKALVRASGDSRYLERYQKVSLKFREYMETTPDCAPAGSGCVPIVYFSAEYGLHHSLPFYAGGLGFLAGDYLKECSDMNVPAVGVGFMYPEGYLSQKIRADGWQVDVNEVLDRDNAPITRVLDDTGNQLVVKVPLVEPDIRVTVWKVTVGRVPLFLLDTDIPANEPWNRSISAHLYTGNIEQRLRQEIVLGIGGYKILDMLGVVHAVTHLNEGHAAFALLERVRENVQAGLSYDEALEQVRATSIFTTHTSLPSGVDIFPFELIDRYFHHYYPLLGLSRDEFMRLGTRPGNPGEGFNMTVFALRLAGTHNAVSRRHREVTRGIWKDLWNGWQDSVVNDYVTNGVHVPTWIEPKMELLIQQYLGADWIKHHDDPAVWEHIDDIPDKELWQAHFWLKMKLINTIRERARQRWVQDREIPSVVLSEGTLLDPSVLTIGFARRFTSYKRADLIFTDLSRLKALVRDRWKPIQIIFAGKAHPSDDPGKRILQHVFSFANDPEFNGRIAFVENYDEQLAQYIVHGVDVWLNNPLPPLEACGTSGMKASLNGVPHLSIADGWWMEGYNGKNGWIFGKDSGDDRDSRDAAELYSLLEQEIIPLFYAVDDDGTPVGWVRTMKEAMKSTGPRFSTRRMLKEYLDYFYRGAMNRAQGAGEIT
jgi:starch phosphorylase